MSINRAIRVIAGLFIMLSLALGFYVNQNFYWFTAFVGFNLFQSGISRWCLMEKILTKFGMKH